MILDSALATIRTIRPELDRLRVRSVGIFGSVARGEECPESDVDVLVEFDGQASLFDVVRVKHLLEDRLGRTVDIVTPGALSPNCRDSIYRDLKHAA